MIVVLIMQVVLGSARDGGLFRSARPRNVTHGPVPVSMQLLPAARLAALGHASAHGQRPRHARLALLFCRPAAATQRSTRLIPFPSHLFDLTAFIPIDWFSFTSGSANSDQNRTQSIIKMSIEITELGRKLLRQN